MECIQFQICFESNQITGNIVFLIRYSLHFSFLFFITFYKKTFIRKNKCWMPHCTINYCLDPVLCYLHHYLSLFFFIIIPIIIGSHLISAHTLSYNFLFIHSYFLFSLSTINPTVETTLRTPPTACCGPPLGGYLQNKQNPYNHTPKKEKKNRMKELK